MTDPTLPENDERTLCEVWTRVMGYYRPTCLFNTGKKGEHKERKHFKEPDLSPREVKSTL